MKNVRSEKTERHALTAVGEMADAKRPKVNGNSEVSTPPAEPAESFFDRSRSALRHLWKGWTGGGKSDLGTLRPDLPNDDLEIVRHHVDACLSGRGGQVSARARAAELGRAYLDLTPDGKRRFFTLLATRYGHDFDAIQNAARDFLEASDAGSADGKDGGDAAPADHLDRVMAAHDALRKAMRSPRVELLKQFNSLEQGIKFLADLRADLIQVRRELDTTDPQWAAFDNELRDLLTSWFDVGFLHLEQITWDAPASLLEKLVQYEAVHAIRGTEDMRNRLQSDRRCYAFFHPNMPNEPLIFVEVALTNGIADNVQTLLDQKRETQEAELADTAIFYSISNAQAGLAGVGFGDFLIKRVVRELTLELPKLKTFATLSPIPGFRSWLEMQLSGQAALLSEAELKILAKLSAGDPQGLLLSFFARRSGKIDKEIISSVRPILLRLCAVYLTSLRKSRDGRLRAIDPVGHFHLSNGARIERLNWRGDRSIKGLEQSAGIMVNYLYKLSDIERNHEIYTDKGEISMSNGIKSLI